MAGDTWKGKRRGKGRVEIENGFPFPPPPLSSLRLQSSVLIKKFPPPPLPLPAPIYCVVQFFRILYFSWRITFFLIINYLFNFNLYEGKKLVAFNWELVTLSGCKRLPGRFPVLSSLNIVQWPTWRSSELGRNQKCLPHARKKPPVPRVITGFKWKTTPTQPQTQPIFFFFSQKMVRRSTVACVAWRFWSGAQTSQDGRGQWNCEEIWAGSVDSTKYV